MDDIDAPQWADFITPSPQISVDDYFLKRNEKHELNNVKIYREQLDSIDSDSPNLSVKKINQGKQVLNESTYSYDNSFKTPLKGACSKSSTNMKKSKLKETTYENVLMEAMNNLQLSFKKIPGEKSLNKTCLMDMPAFITPVKRVTRSMCTQAVNTPKFDLDESHYVSLENEKSIKFSDHICEEDKENFNSKKCSSPSDLCKHIEHYQENINNYVNKSPVCISGNEHNKDEQRNESHESPSSNEQASEINLEVTATSTEHEISHDKFDFEATEEKVHNNEASKSEQPLQSKVVTSFTTEKTDFGNVSKKKLPTTLTGTAWRKQMKRRMSISNHRLSINKALPSSKYVSMAEAVSKFQRATPQRFRTITTTTTTTKIKTTRTEQLRKSFKLTKAISPALRSKTRTRPVTVLSTEERELLELEKIRQNQIKANPVPKEILKKPVPLKQVEKKMVTNPKPFDLTAFRKVQSTKQNQEIKRIPRMHTKTAPSIVSTDDKGVIIKDEEVLHFGIPCKTKKQNTKVKPFSFETRNKELQLKKQEKLKILQEMEQQKVKTEFHARPVPIAVKTPIAKSLQRENSTSKPKITITRSLSFEERHKELQKKKEEKIKQLLEEEKKARTFKAQKVPEFKPVIIRGRSKDNLFKKSNDNLVSNSYNMNTSAKKTSNTSFKKSQESLTMKQKSLIKKQSIPFTSKKVTPLSTVPQNQENKTGAVPKILEPKCKLSQKSVAILTELNTDKRAKQRKEFEEQIKKKEMEEKEMRKKEEEERLAKEKAEKMELRKMTEIKARPMPVYKPMTVVRSTKQLTEAQSPAWAKRKGSTH